MESEEQIRELIQIVHSQGIDVGISIKPQTSVQDIEKYLEDVDLVLVMSVEPGFGGQPFQKEAVDKIQQLSQLKEKYDFLIEVDGGINAQTGLLCRDAGVDVLVAGSYIFHAEDRKKAIDSLK